MNIVDHKYILLIGAQLPMFKKKGPNVWSAKCRFCGDSQKKKSKTRGYIFFKGGRYHYYCHNCNISLSLGQLIEHFDRTLYNEYKLEKYRKPQPTIQHNVEYKPRTKVIPSVDGIRCVKISSLPADHPAKLYVMSRKIPPSQHYRLYYTNKFARYVNTLIPEKLKTEFDGPRLVIPFFDKDKNIFGLQGRSFSDKGLRYITIMINEDLPKIFGLDAFDKTKKHYAVEGPIDSLFLPNALAFAGSDFNCVHDIVDKKLCTIVFDNERRSKEICRKIEQAIEEKYNVCIWPAGIKGKDINNMLLDGLDPQTIIDKNTFNGLAAKNKFTAWKRC